MYHDPKPITAQPAWPDDLQRGDVVQFRFPLAEGESKGQRPPKKRPCLVLEIETKGSRRFATLAYGTDAQTKANQGYSIFVRRGGAMAGAGLTKPTHFVCARRITVAVDHVGFEASPATGSPIIGRLDETLLERMNALRARIHAKHDIAVERRRERDEERRRWQWEERGFRQRNRALRAATSPRKDKPMPDLCLDNLDHFIANAISTAHVVIVALGEDAIPHLPATRRSFAKDVRGRMNPDRLFETQTIFDLDGLIEVLETAILSGTHEETILDNSLENVSTTGWTQRHDSASAEALGRALIVILHLRETLQDIQDLRDTQRVLNRMHAEP